MQKRFALAGSDKDGPQDTRLFSEWILEPDGADLFIPDDFKMALGIRNSVDKSISYNICGGESVMVCGNMCFWGQFVMTRKHTSQIMNDIVGRVDAALEAYLGGFRDREREIAAWKQIEINQTQTDHAVVECMRKGAFKANMIPRILDVSRSQTIKDDQGNLPWNGDFAPRTVWSLTNALTEAQKTRKGDPNRLASYCMVGNGTIRDVFAKESEAIMAA